jgi:ribosomal protein S18 acetylase RimI-like enzyme
MSERIARVQEKLADAGACLIVARDEERVVAMALAESYRDQDGAGSIVTGAAHVSMVFVDPTRWSSGIGGRLLAALHQEMQARGWNTGSLWTRASNHRGRRLYEGQGYRVTGNVKRLPGGEEILRYEIRLGHRAASAPSAK